MCLIALALDEDRRFPLVVAANRDEFYDRPAARLSWWSPHEQAAPVLAGRDLQAGGTWLGLNAAGRMALLTNIRRPHAVDAASPSRGGIVPLWLRGETTPDRFWMQVALSGHAPFNLLAADFRSGQSWWASSDHASPRRLERGVYGLSNAALDTPWPKVDRLKQQLRESLVGAESAHALSRRLFAALADRAPAADDALPSTGVPLEWERALSSAFIHEPQRRYGTRCSTLVITERASKRLVTHVFERSFAPQGGATLLRHAVLRDWPPQAGADFVPPPDAEVHEVVEVVEGHERGLAPSTRRVA